VSEFGLEQFLEHLREKADELQTLQDLSLDKVQEAEYRGAEMAFRQIGDFLESLMEE
jgi:hypothetical protein